MFYSFLVTAILIELTPGPNMTWLAVLGSTRGRLVALAAVAGIALGLGIAAIVAGVGLTALFNKMPMLFDGLRWAGTAYLLYLAWDAWRDADGQEVNIDGSALHGFTQGLITNILNPKAYLFYAAMLPQFVVLGSPASPQIAILSATYVAVATLIHAGIALLAGTAETWLRSSSQAITIRKILAVLIMLAAAWFFYSTKVI
jgi:threonine/homoserine/homoserine lactone efflux protein